MKFSLLIIELAFLLVSSASVNCVFASFEQKLLYSKIDSTWRPENFVETGRMATEFGISDRNEVAKKDGSVVLVVILGVLLAVLLAFIVYIMAFGGASSALLAAVGFGGLALIILGVRRLIRGIRRKRVKVN